MIITGMAISIHALREEGDQHIRRSDGQAERFLSTPSARRATDIHFRFNDYIFDFYPRPPRGGRPYDVWLAAYRSKFLSTPSARRATKSQAVTETKLEISIHALREEGDNFGSGGHNLGCISIHALREEGD